MNSDTSSSEDSIVFRRINVKSKRKRAIILSSDSEVEELTAKNKELNTWSRANLNPHIHTFIDEDCGIKTENIKDTFNVLDYFQIFFSENLVGDIVNTTNSYYRHLSSNNISSSLKNWSDTTINEMFTFFALTLTMSRMKKLSIKEYWTTHDVLKTDIFNKHMSRDRYTILLKMLYFSDKKSESSKDRLAKIRGLFDKLREIFKKSFSPFRNLCIDESLLLFKGRLFFKHYIPSKRNRFGIKSFVLCDCSTGYVLDVIVYTGSTSEMQAFSAKLGKAGNIVATLMQPYLGKGHQLFVTGIYNWYSSRIISTISCTRKTLKWYKKFFFHLLDISIWNAYCLYKFNTKKNISMSDYYLALITELLKQYSESRKYNSDTPSAYLMRFKERHFPALYSSDKTKRQNPMRRCIVCSMDNKRRSTRYYCKQCNVGLCVVPCFEMYHTEQ